MNTSKIGTSTFRLGLYLLAALILAACDNNDNNNAPVVTTPEPTPPAPVTQEFEVTVVNATLGQPFSPIAIVAHNNDYSLFTVGNPATAGLEVLAEGGDNADLIAEAEAATGVTATASANGPTGPGASASLSLSVEEDELEGLLLSTVTMLVNSNDAIMASRNMSLEGMQVGDSKTVVSISYDTGTEANTEAAGTIPGPADGGEGFNAARDDLADQVTAHAGVVTSDNGLSTSILNHMHRWDHPVAYISVTRMQ